MLHHILCTILCFYTFASHAEVHQLNDNILFDEEYSTFSVCHDNIISILVNDYDIDPILVGKSYEMLSNMLEHGFIEISSYIDYRGSRNYKLDYVLFHNENIAIDAMTYGRRKIYYAVAAVGFGVGQVVGGVVGNVIRAYHTGRAAGQLIGTDRLVNNYYSI